MGAIPGAAAENLSCNSSKKQNGLTTQRDNIHARFAIKDLDDTSMLILEESH